MCKNILITKPERITCST